MSLFGEIIYVACAQHCDSKRQTMFDLCQHGGQKVGFMVLFGEFKESGISIHLYPDNWGPMVCCWLIYPPPLSQIYVSRITD